MPDTLPPWHLCPERVALGAAAAKGDRHARLLCADWHDDRGEAGAADLLRRDGAVVRSGPERGRLGWEVWENGLDPAAPDVWTSRCLGLVNLTPGEPEMDAPPIRLRAKGHALLGFERQTAGSAPRWKGSCRCGLWHAGAWTQADVRARYRRHLKDVLGITWDDEE